MLIFSFQILFNIFLDLNHLLTNFALFKFHKYFGQIFLLHLDYHHFYFLPKQCIIYKNSILNNSFLYEGNTNSVYLNFKKNILEFLNNDLIKPIDNDLTELKDIWDISDFYSSNDFIGDSSECLWKLTRLNSTLNILKPLRILIWI